MIELGDASPLLFGQDPEEGIVNVAASSDSTMTVTTRADAHGVRSRVDSVFPFFFLSQSEYLSEFEKKYWLKALDGDEWYRYLCAFQRLGDMWEAVRLILKRRSRETGTTLEQYSDTDALLLRPDPVTQFLLQTGKSLFKGMKFEELNRLQLDIETYSAGRFSNPAKPSDRVILISLTDSTGWEKAIDGSKMSEPEMFEEVCRIVAERDPDVIEGHNVLGFDLPYLEQRAQVHSVDLPLGRDRQPLRRGGGRQAERGMRGFPVYEIPGREIVDTLLLLQNYDTAKRVLESHSLKYAARFFNLSSENRVYIAGDRISWYWDHERDLLVRYGLDDARETRALSAHLCPVYFYLCQVVPLTLSQTITSGAAAKIELLLMREYIRQKHSLPRPEPSRDFPGGYTEVFVTGIVGPVLHVDVESLYPSIMLLDRIKPSRDRLDVFLSLLERLTALRIEQKNHLKSTTTPARRSALDAMQSSLKILINSFYGYLGYSRGLFNDYTQAAAITELGRDILQRMMGAIRELGGRVVEVDTDGVYFTPPPSLQEPEQEGELVERISAALPGGIRIVIDGRYRKMLSYKKKNYALLDVHDHIVIKGSALVSRSMERFLRDFVVQFIDALFRGDLPGVRSLYQNLREDIIEHRLGVRNFTRTEALRVSPEAYAEEVASKGRARSAAYELALKSGRTYRAGSRISYYITGSDPDPVEFESCKLADEWSESLPDENAPYYLRRLDEFLHRFEFLLPKQAWEKIFGSSSLFEMTEEELRAVTLNVEVAPDETDDAEERDSSSEPDLWSAADDQ